MCSSWRRLGGTSGEDASRRGVALPKRSRAGPSPRHRRPDPAAEEHTHRRPLVLERGYEASLAGSSVDGYVMLGLREPNEALFRGIPWSTDAVYRETVDKAHTLGLMVHKGELHYDVDSPEDLVHLKKELEGIPKRPAHGGVLEEPLNAIGAWTLMSAPHT